MTDFTVSLDADLEEAVERLRGERTPVEFIHRCVERAVVGETRRQLTFQDKRLQKTCEHPNRSVKSYGTVCPDCHSILGTD